MTQTTSSTIFFTENLEHVSQQIQNAKTGTTIHQFEALGEILQHKESEPFPFTLTFEQAARRPMLVLHSSGSTGVPKPITLTHGSFCAADNDFNMPKIPGRKNQDMTVFDFGGKGGKFYTMFPQFHVAGFYSTTVVPIYTHASLVYGPPLKPPSGSLVRDILQEMPIQGIYVPPTIIEYLLGEPGGSDHLSRLEFVVFAGGPLAQSAGDKLSSKTLLCQFYGSTEIGQAHQLVPRREDWAWMEWHPDLRCEMRPAEDDAYEMVLFPPQTESDGPLTTLSYNFPGIKEWQTKDLFKPHPHKAGLWRFHGRRDDIIVLSNGEKFNPVPFETVIAGHSDVSGALVAGQGRFQAALLVEPKADADRSSLVEKIWPLVQKANAMSPGYARITKSKIILAQSGKAFVRAGKGTVVRKLTERLYGSEIEALYEEQHPFQSSLQLKPTFGAQAVKDFVRSAVSSSFPGSNIHDDDNMTLIGLDSLKSLDIIGTLKTELRKYHSNLSWLSVQRLYETPTIDGIASLLLSFLNTGRTPDRPDRFSRMQDLVEKYTSRFSQITPKRGITDNPDVRVALIGSRGNLGSRLLDSLHSTLGPAQVVCFDRPTSDKATIASEVDKHQIQLREEDLGLSQEGLIALESCSLILLNAWPVNFSQSLDFFAENIGGIFNIIRFLLRRSMASRILFTSSTSAVAANTEEKSCSHPRMETFLDTRDHRNALSTGYAESKNVAEVLLGKAAEYFQLPITVLRIGQVAGPVSLIDKSSWSGQEWVPSMLKTSKTLGILPGALPSIDWIPVDKVARIMVEIIESLSGRTDSQVFNVVHPHPTTWASQLTTTETLLGVKAVPMTEWLAKLDAINLTQVSIDDYPAVKLWQTFEEMAKVTEAGTPRFNTRNSKAYSKTFRDLQPVDEAWMRIWIERLGLEA